MNFKQYIKEASRWLGEEEEAKVTEPNTSNTTEQTPIQELEKSEEALKLFKTKTANVFTFIKDLSVNIMSDKIKSNFPVKLILFENGDNGGSVLFVGGKWNKGFYIFKPSGSLFEAKDSKIQEGFWKAIHEDHSIKFDDPDKELKIVTNIYKFIWKYVEENAKHWQSRLKEQGSSPEEIAKKIQPK